MPLNADAVAALEATRGQHPRWCFTFAGKRIQQSSTAWDKAKQRAGIEHFRFHDLRHTWASWHVQSGTSLAELMELGGWKSYEMVLRYAQDTKHHMIVAHEVTNVGHDREQLSPMAQQTSDAIDEKDLTVLADRGYYKGQQIYDCEQAGFKTLVPKSQTSGNKAAGQFDKADFRYIPSKDEYRCPAGQRAIWRYTTVEDGLTIHKYWSSACPRCPVKAQCTTNNYRRITRWEHEDVLDKMQKRLNRTPRLRGYAVRPQSIPSARSRPGWERRTS